MGLPIPIGLGKHIHLPTLSLGRYYSFLLSTAQSARFPPVPDGPNWTAILASNVRSRRKELRLSQEELAHRVGVDVRYLGGIEREQENPTLKVIISIATALDATPIELLTAP